MATRKKYNAARLEEAAVEAAVKQTQKIKDELRKEAEQDKAFNSIKLELSCRRVKYRLSPLSVNILVLLIVIVITQVRCWRQENHKDNDGIF